MHGYACRDMKHLCSLFHQESQHACSASKDYIAAQYVASLVMQLEHTQEDTEL